MVGLVVAAAHLLTRLIGFASGGGTIVIQSHGVVEHCIFCFLFELQL